MISKQLICQQLRSIDSLLDKVVDVDMGYCSCRIESNSQILLDRLADYFSFVVEPLAQPGCIIQAIETDAVNLSVEFIDWKREPGKTGRKDSYIDLDDARLIRKVRTGMVFLQSQDCAIAVGPCLQNDNQLINFITSQMMNALQQHDWLICHAAAIVHDGQTCAIAGFSGGGKSSLMLALLEQHDTKFLTNDRLFIKAKAGKVAAAGIPKMPRINPGTTVHQPRLRALVSEPERRQLLNLPEDELWQLEQKYDVDIERFYGLERIRYQAPLKALLILNWSREVEVAVQLHPVNLRERPELLKAVMKSPGPFYQDAQGQFITDDYQCDQQAYLAVLDKIRVFEATGQVDFQTLSRLYLAAAE